jgi:hypothetical protein
MECINRNGGNWLREGVVFESGGAHESGVDASLCHRTPRRFAQVGVLNNQEALINARPSLDIGMSSYSASNYDHGRSVAPMRKRSHSRAAPRPSLKAQTTRLWPRRQSPAANTPGMLVTYFSCSAFTLLR